MLRLPETAKAAIEKRWEKEKEKPVARSSREQAECMQDHILYLTGLTK